MGEYSKSSQMSVQPLCLKIGKRVERGWSIDEGLLGTNPARHRGSTFGISGLGCAAGTLEPLTYTRASSAKFCYPILEYTRVN